MTDKSISTDNILKNCVEAIKCPRGKYYPDKNFGSQILENVSHSTAPELLAYARQAVNDIDGVYVKNVQINGAQAIFTLLINDQQRQVKITL